MADIPEVNTNRAQFYCTNAAMMCLGHVVHSDCAVRSRAGSASAHHGVLNEIARELGSVSGPGLQQFPIDKPDLRRIGHLERDKPAQKAARRRSPDSPDFVAATILSVI